MQTGKIKTIAKKMNNGGSHDSWAGDKGTFYKYIVTINSGGSDIIGESMAKSADSTPYKEGDEVEFEVTTTQYGNRLKVKKKDSAEQKSYGPNMEHIARQASFNLVLDISEGFTDPAAMNLKLAKQWKDAFHKYLIKDTDKANIYARIASLGMVVRIKKLMKPEHLKNVEHFISAAEKFESHIISGTELPEEYTGL